MDSVQGYEKQGSPLASNGIAKANTSIPASTPIPNNTTNESKVSLTDLSDLARRANESQPDIRPDVIARAQTLLNDPNWLNDDNLDVLAERLIDFEKI